MFTNVVAVLALILSTLSLYHQWRTSRVTLRVTARIEPQSLPVRESSSGSLICELVPALNVLMTNRCDRPVHILQMKLSVGWSSIEFMSLNRRYRGILRPFTVEPLRTVPVAVEGTEIGYLLRAHGVVGTARVRVVVLDEAGMSHTSSAIRVNVDDLVEGAAGPTGV